ncbi:MAG: CHRD domain-containing protein [Ignavibacteriae bacterium]|nr:MAG: CHRD domain-containing protein [Ignavibacteriota bacterium]
MKHIPNFFFLLLIALISIQPLQAQISVRATIDGNQAGTSSAGHGVMFGQFSSDMKTLSYQITYAKLQGNFTAAHFHFAPTGGVIQPITFHGNTAVGTWIVPDTLLKYFFREGIYVNIHSNVYPGGEIRGSVIPTQVLFPITLDSTLSGTQSTAFGTGWLRIKEDTVPSLEYDMTFAGLSAPYTAMHIHTQPSGTVLFPLHTADSASSFGTWTTYPDSVLKLLVQGKLYVNVHSTLHPAGEIRGAITPNGAISFAANLDGVQAGTTSPGRGTGWAVLNADLSAIRYSVSYTKLQGTYTASHFHTAVTGGVIHPITFTDKTSVGQWTGFSDANLEDLLRGKVYVNIHSSVSPGGEIRGALKYSDGTFTTTLDGSQSGTGSPAKGTAWIHFNQQSDSLSYQATFSGLTGTFTASHFHIAPQGSVIFPLSYPDSATTSGFWPPVDSLIPKLVQGNIYINVHSTAFPAGEIRGAFKSGSGTVTDVPKTPQEIPAAFRLEQNYPNPFNPNTSIHYQLAQSGHLSLRVYDLLGRTVATLFDGEQPAGQYHFEFDGHALASGLYFYRLSTGHFSQARKMLLLK